MTRERLVFVLPVIFFAALALGFYITLRSMSDHALPSTLIGKQPRPFDVPLLAADGTVDEAERLTDADFRNGRVSVVNFWASWCGPCKIEHPQLMALAAQPGLTLYGIAYKNEPDEARGFLDQRGDPFDRIGLDESGRLGIDWGITGVPETFVLDGRGVVVFKHTGPLMPADLNDRLLPAIARAATP